MKFETVSIHHAINQMLEKTGETDHKKGVQLFMENQKNVGEICAVYSMALATRDDEMECSPYRQIAKAAIELAMLVDRGIDCNEAVHRLMLDSNEATKKRHREEVAKGGKPSISNVCIAEEGIEVKEGKIEDAEEVH